MPLPSLSQMDARRVRTTSNQKSADNCCRSLTQTFGSTVRVLLGHSTSDNRHRIRGMELLSMPAFCRHASTTRKIIGPLLGHVNAVKIIGARKNTSYIFAISSKAHWMPAFNCSRFMCAISVKSVISKKFSKARNPGRSANSPVRILAQA